mmetsp:Transcript_26789/g.62953  ORF Transcript_26789/g.62953 Transcript_26789/m.62953 type:complete len:235 (+) Transcript_26789:61-765(+)
MELSSVGCGIRALLFPEFLVSGGRLRRCETLCSWRLDEQLRVSTSTKALSFERSPMAGEASECNRYNGSGHNIGPNRCCRTVVGKRERGIRRPRKLRLERKTNGGRFLLRRRRHHHPMRRITATTRRTTSARRTRSDPGLIRYRSARSKDIDRTWKTNITYRTTGTLRPSSTGTEVPRSAAICARTCTRTCRPFSRSRSSKNRAVGPLPRTRTAPVVTRKMRRKPMRMRMRTRT